MSTHSKMLSRFASVASPRWKEAGKIAVGTLIVGVTAYATDTYPFSRRAVVEQLHSASESFSSAHSNPWFTPHLHAPADRCEKYLTVMKRTARSLDVPYGDPVNARRRSGEFSREKTVQLKEWKTSFHYAAEKLSGHDCTTVKANGKWDGRYFDVVVLKDDEGAMSEVVEATKRE